jgi:hypothetical protein
MLLLGLLAVVAAGCGSRDTKPYTAQGSVACFAKKGFKKVTTNPAKVGFIAAFADNGGLRATTADNNTLTIAFGADETSVASTEAAFKTHAPPKLRPHITDIMEAQRNAVLVWTVTPTSDDLAAATGCLHS